MSIGGFFDASVKLMKSAIDIVHATAVKMDEDTKRKLQRMSDDEIISMSDKQPTNKYVKEEKERRGL